MKVIFLDVDGVLNSESDLIAYRQKNNIDGCIFYGEVEVRPLRLLKEIVDNTNAKIVVTSSWRIGCKRKDGHIVGGKQYTKLTNRLKEYGLDIYDITPCLRDMDRGDEIREWLSNNPVDNFIILDDDTDMCEFLHTDHFIKTTYKYGLTKELKDKSIRNLNRN